MECFVSSSATVTDMLHAFTVGRCIMSCPYLDLKLSEHKRIESRLIMLVICPS